MYGNVKFDIDLTLHEIVSIREALALAKQQYLGFVAVSDMLGPV